MNDEEGLATIEAAIDLGVRFFDTARAYGDNEALVGRAFERTAGANGREGRMLITKCGMRPPDEPGSRWIAEGKAASILRDAKTSREILGRVPDVLLLHAPDPRVPFATSIRALVRARDEGLTKAIGLSNVTRKDLDALDPPDLEIAAIEVALGAYDDGAARGGVVAWCKDRNIPLLAHSALGGPTKAPRLARDTTLRAVASRHPEGTTPAMIVLRYLLHVSEVIVPIVGARRPASIASALRAEDLVLDERDLELLDARFPGLAVVRNPQRKRSKAGLGASGAEVVILMGLVGSGKSLLAQSYVDRGYTRLNRDLIGGTLKGIAERLGSLLAQQPDTANDKTKKFVLDNTYVTRASRSDVLRVAHSAGASVKCVFIDTSSADSQINCTLRMLEKHGELLGGADLAARAKSDANLFMPSTLFRMEKMLERPSPDEGFDAIEVIPFTRRPRESLGQPSILLPVDFVLGENPKVPLLNRDAAAKIAEIPPDTPILIFGWRTSTSAEWKSKAGEILAALDRRRVVPPGKLELAICNHAAGPPTCWCRPPLPGLFLAFAQKHNVDARLSLILPTSPTHRTMARHLGLTILDH